jgi:hypothetical protein
MERDKACAEMAITNLLMLASAAAAYAKAIDRNGFNHWIAISAHDIMERQAELTSRYLPSPAQQKEEGKANASIPQRRDNQVVLP